MKNEDSDYKLHEFVAHSTGVNCLTFGPQSAQVVATGGEDCKVNIWRVDNTANIWSLGQNKSPIECLCFDAEEQYLVSGARSGSIKVFDLNEGKLARSLRGHQTNVSSIHYHPYGEFIVSGSVDNTMKVWDVRSKMCIQTYTGHEKEVTCVRFSPDGRWVASSGRDGQFLVWDLVAGKLIQTIRTKNNYLNSFEFNPSEFLLAGTSSDKTVKFWDLETFERVGRTTPDTSPVTSVAFSEEGASLCAASNGTLRVWGWDPTVVSKATLSMDWDNVYEMRVAPNTNQLVAGSFISNFVSIYSVDLDELLGIGEQEDMDGSDQEEDSVVDESQPVHLDNTPEKLHESLAKEVPDDDSEDKWGDDYENDFEDDFKLDKLDLGGEKDSKGSSGPGVEWDAGTTPRDLAASMGESFLAKLKEDERRARHNDQDGRSSPRSRPSSSAITAPRHRQPPKRPTTTSASPAPKAVVRKPVSHYNGVDGSGNGQGGMDCEGLEIVGSKHAHARVGSRDRDGDSGAAAGGRIGTGGYRYATESPDEGTNEGARDRDRDRDRAAERNRERERERERVRERERAAERRRRLMTPEEKQESQQPSYLQPTESSAAKDKDTEELLDRLLDQSGEVMTALSQRLTNLRLLNQYWGRGDISIIIEHLKTILMTSKHDPSGCVVLADFFSSVDLKASHIVSLDVCGKILPVLDGMLAIGLEEVSLAALVGVISLAESYGPLIADTRGVVGRHVDISREERIEKCNVSHKAFSLILDKCDNLKQQNRKSSNVLFRNMLDRAQSLLLNIV